MTGSVAFWVAMALPIFWSMGAYNRLIRLRALAIDAFSAIDDQFKRHIELVKTGFAQPDATSVPPANESDPNQVVALLAGLRGAAEQFDACLKMVRTQPLAAPAMGALQTAHQTLHAAWARVQNQAHDVAGSRLPEPLPARWNQLSASADIACAEFNRRVEAYNDAITQFPAVMLAWLFGFSPAKSL